MAFAFPHGGGEARKVVAGLAALRNFAEQVFICIRDLHQSIRHDFAVP